MASDLTAIEKRARFLSQTVAGYHDVVNHLERLIEYTDEQRHEYEVLRGEFEQDQL